MTQEEKDLLLKDLMARLHYKVCAKQYYSVSEDDFIIEGIIGEQIYAAYNSKISMTYPVEKIKPYLRPMSSMTEEEKIELCIRAYAPDEMKTIDEKLYVIQTNAKNATDFYNEHHLDYRGLIPIGLALEAPNDMYNTKTE